MKKTEYESTTNWHYICIIYVVKHKKTNVQIVQMSIKINLFLFVHSIFYNTLKTLWSNVSITCICNDDSKNKSENIQLHIYGLLKRLFEIIILKTNTVNPVFKWRPGSVVFSFKKKNKIQFQLLLVTKKPLKYRIVVILLYYLHSVYWSRIVVVEFIINIRLTNRLFLEYMFFNGWRIDWRKTEK